MVMECPNMKTLNIIIRFFSHLQGGFTVIVWAWCANLENIGLPTVQKHIGKFQFLPEMDSHQKASSISNGVYRCLR